MLCSKVAPAHHAHPKLAAHLQASGEAQFTDDIPAPLGTLHAAYVTAAHARATVLAIDPAAALALPGVSRFVGAADITGKNEGFWVPWFASEVPVFVPVGGETLFHSQPVGLVLADTLRHAEKAAAAVAVRYEVLQPTVTLDAALAVEACAAFAPPLGPGELLVFGHARGDAKKELAAAEAARASGAEVAPRRVVRGEVFMKQQQHFYMEYPRESRTRNPLVPRAQPAEQESMRSHPAAGRTRRSSSPSRAAASTSPAPTSGQQACR
jgi:xanthine dehydrogenase/oxidase